MIDSKDAIEALIAQLNIKDEMIEQLKSKQETIVVDEKSASNLGVEFGEDYINIVVQSTTHPDIHIKLGYGDLIDLTANFTVAIAARGGEDKLLMTILEEGLKRKFPTN